ncbi:hypothetical protein K438DRAFT_1849856 [Mycena galopus ATCC 62051]|nr:hypothetical protein K438DRAFT_1849856 [Mycena galopus ATCC 62051]
MRLVGVCLLRFCSSFDVAGVGGDEDDAQAHASCSRIGDAHAPYGGARQSPSNSALRLLGGRAEACVHGMLIVVGDDASDAR